MRHAQPRTQRRRSRRHGSRPRPTGRRHGHSPPHRRLGRGPPAPPRPCESYPPPKAAAFLSRLAKARKRGVEVDEEAIERIEDVSRNVVAALERYGPRVLRLVER